MANIIDLVTQSQLEAYLNSSNQNFNATTADVLLPLIITACSRTWLTHTGRRALNRFVPCNDFFDGSGGDRQFLRDFPFATVGGVWVNGISIPQGGYGQNGTVTWGWVPDQKRESISFVGGSGNGWGVGYGSGSGSVYAATGGPLTRQFVGSRFGSRHYDGKQNVQVQYFAGGSISFSETWTIPESSPYEIEVAQAAAFYTDLGVIYGMPQNGQLVPFSSVETPTEAGQYSVNPSTGFYTFSEFDAGVDVALNYAYNAADEEVQMYALEQMAATYAKRTQAGLKQQGAPETGTTTFTWDEVVTTPRVMAIMNKKKRAMVGM